jgi:spermidine synthase
MRRALPLLLLPLAACGSSAEIGDIVHQERSLYRNIYVAEEGRVRCMYFRLRGSPGKQSCIDLDDPQRLVSEYSRLMLAGLYVQPQPRRILMIGLGGGVVPAVLQHLLPEAEIEAVEIDPAVIRVAGSHFNFKAGPKTRVHADDGRVFIKRQLAAGAKYDIVMLDAYDGEYIPEHLLTLEFLREVGGLLNPAAPWCPTPGRRAASTTMNQRLMRRPSDRSEPALTQPDHRGRSGGAAPRGSAGCQCRCLRAAPAAVRVSQGALLPLIKSERDWDPAARVLTDQYSPSNLLGSGG